MCDDAEVIFFFLILKLTNSSWQIIKLIKIRKFKLLFQIYLLEEIFSSERDGLVEILIEMWWKGSTRIVKKINLFFSHSKANVSEYLFFPSRTPFEPWTRREKSSETLVFEWEKNEFPINLFYSREFFPLFLGCLFITSH